MAHHELFVQLETRAHEADRPEWHHSTFPHALITVDHREDDTPFYIAAYGTLTFLVADAYAKGGTAVEIVERVKQFVEERGLTDGNL
jgi:hypothetical protein